MNCTQLTHIKSIQFDTYTLNRNNRYNQKRAYIPITSRSFIPPVVIPPSHFPLPPISYKSLIHFLSLYVCIYFIVIYIKLINRV